MWVDAVASLSLLRVVSWNLCPRSWLGSLGSFGVGVQRSGFAIWASRVSKGNNDAFGRPTDCCQYHRCLDDDSAMDLGRCQINPHLQHQCTESGLTTSQIGNSRDLEILIELLDTALFPRDRYFREMMAEIQRRFWSTLYLCTLSLRDIFKVRHLVGTSN